MDISATGGSAGGQRGVVRVGLNVTFSEGTDHRYLLSTLSQSVLSISFSVGCHMVSSSSSSSALTCDFGFAVGEPFEATMSYLGYVARGLLNLLRCSALLPGSV